MEVLEKVSSAPERRDAWVDLSVLSVSQGSANLPISRGMEDGRHERLIGVLCGHQDVAERFCAAQGLGLLAPEDPELIVPALEMAAIQTGQNPFVIEAALDSIGRYGEYAACAYPTLRSLFSHEFPNVRRAAVMAAGKVAFFDDAVADDLLALLSDSALSVRKAAAEVLSSQTGCSLRAQPIRDLLMSSEGDESLIAKAVKLCRSVREKDEGIVRALCSRLVGACPELRVVIVDELKRRGDEVGVVYGTLVDLLANPLEELNFRVSLSEVVVEAKGDPDLLLKLVRVLKEEILESNQERIAQYEILKTNVRTAVKKMLEHLFKYRNFLVEDEFSDNWSVIKDALLAMLESGADGRREAVELIEDLDPASRSIILSDPRLEAAVKRVRFKSGAKSLLANRGSLCPFSEKAVA